MSPDPTPAAAKSAAGEDAFNHGCSLIAAQHLEAGITSLLAADGAGWDPPAVAHALGVAYRIAGNAPHALHWFSIAVARDPSDLLSCQDFASASAHFRAWPELAHAASNWAKLTPQKARPWHLWSRALHAQRRFRSALAVLLMGWRRNKADASLAAAIGTLYSELCRCARGIGFLRKAVTLDPAAQSARSNLLLSVTCDDAQTAATQFLEHRRAGQAYPPAPAARQHRKSPTRRPRLRVGYVSGDFRRHPLERFYEAIFTHRTRSRIELCAYSNTGPGDAVTPRFRSWFDTWRDITSLHDDNAAAIIAADELDILIDLSGHTLGNRLGIFSRRPATVQITHCGYPNTTGLAQMDWILTDSIVDPPGIAESLLTEQPLRIDPCLLCYTPPPDAPEPLATSNRPLTFGCTNALRKLSPSTLDLWARVLLAVPASRLLLKTAVLADPAVATRVKTQFSRRDIAPSRIVCEPFDYDETSYLATYRELDVMLDPFPCNGATTTCDALWMGVPVVTKTGDTRAARIGASLLHAAGHPEWVAESDDTYVQIASSLAATRTRLQRKHLQGTPLMDATSYSKNYEAALCGSAPR